MKKLILSLSIITLSLADPDIGKGYAFEGNGKDLTAPALSTLYTPSAITASLDLKKRELAAAIGYNDRYLKRRASTAQHYDNLRISTDQLRAATRQLHAWLNHPKRPLSDYLESYLIRGEDGRGNLHYTGYFVPTYKLKRERDATHIYPLYKTPRAWPTKTPPTREMIDEGQVLQGMGLELGWSESLLESYFLHVQGSGIVEFEDGKVATLAYGGKNGYTYQSIGKKLVESGEIPQKDISLDAIKEWAEENPTKLKPLLYSNPSYTFFTLTNREPYGAANVTLTPQHSIAVDKRYIPLGAILIGEIPILDKEGDLSHHEYRILFAHDQGAAIKGSGHVDIYQGIGEAAKERASRLHHYGKLWLLLPKK